MYIESGTIQFQHGKDEVSDSFSLTKNEATRVKLIIVFETIASDMKVKEFFTTPEEAPIELSSISGMLERCLELCPSMSMKAYLLLMFRDTYSSIQDLIDSIETCSPKAKKLNPLHQALYKVMQELKKAGFDQLRDVIKKTKYDFERFYKEVAPDGSDDHIHGAAEDVNRFLGGLLGGVQRVVISDNLDNEPGQGNDTPKSDKTNKDNEDFLKKLFEDLSKDPEEEDN